MFTNFVDEEGKKRALEFQKFAKLVHLQYIKRHGDQKNLARPFHYFVDAAQKSIRNTIYRQNGEKRGRKIWSSLMNAYPELIIVKNK